MLLLLLNGQEKQACNITDQHSTVYGATATTTGAKVVVVCKSAGGDGKSVGGGSLEGQGGSLEGKGGSQRRGGSGHKIYGYSDSTPTIDGTHIASALHVSWHCHLHFLLGVFLQT